MRTLSIIIRAKTLPGTESSVPPRTVAVLAITLRFPERDNKAPLPVSWDDACVPGRAQNCRQQHEYSISTSLEKFSMDATDPRSFTPFQPVHHSLCFHKRRWTTVDWRVSNSYCNTTDIQLDSWWISLVQPLKVTGPAGLQFGLLCQEPPTLCSNCSTPRDGLGGKQCTNSPCKWDDNHLTTGDTLPPASTAPQDR